MLILVIIDGLPSIYVYLYVCVGLHLIEMRSGSHSIAHWNTLLFVPCTVQCTRVGCGFHKLQVARRQTTSGNLARNLIVNRINMNNFVMCQKLNGNNVIMDKLRGHMWWNSLHYKLTEREREGEGKSVTHTHTHTYITCEYTLCITQCVCDILIHIMKCHTSSGIGPYKLIWVS